jgi:hypothetical protein
MSREEQKKIKDLASKILKEGRSREQIVDTLKGAGILDNTGKIKAPYNQVLVKK